MPFMAAWRPAVESILEILFPTRCVGCRAAAGIWCPECQSRLRAVAGAVCLACRRELPPGRGTHRCEPTAPRAYAAAIYQPPLDRALTHLKYRPDTRLADALAESMARVYRRQRLTASCIVPVPLSPGRRRRRGYNQTELLGRSLAVLLGLPHVPSAAARIRETGSQVGREASERWANVEGAFRAVPDLVAGETVLLIDDVRTTGATLAACSQALLRAGARRVVALTVGRA